MKQLKQFITLASLSAVLSHSSPTAVYSSMDADEGPMSAPAKTAAPTDVTGVNRAPAVEPRVYLESPGSKTGYVYYDTTDRPDAAERAKAQRVPEQD